MKVERQRNQSLGNQFKCFPKLPLKSLLEVPTLLNHCSGNVGYIFLSGEKVI